MCGSACASKDPPSKGTSAFVWKDVRAGMSMFVPGCIETVCGVQYCMEKERRRSLCCFLNGIVPLWHPCCHPCSVTALKGCFGLRAGRDYWGEVAPRPPRQEDTDHSPQKGFFVLLSQLPCSPLVVSPGSCKLLHFLSVWCLGHLRRCPSCRAALRNADCKEGA